ncbi:hypothetical protein ACTWP6_18940 [Mycobacterium sp. 4D054]|uniref:hypothetical protein n=1 Tax=Mycobacterium sp. 4D054 TaxID=3457440 RepID=UPI003FD50599
MFSWTFHRSWRGISRYFNRIDVILEIARYVLGCHRRSQKGGAMTFLAPLVTASVALVGAGVITVTPVTPTTAQMRAAGEQVRLTAATTTDSCGETAVALCDPSGSAQGPMLGAAAQATTSIFNIPANLFIALANVPYNFFNALGQGDVNLGDLPNSGFSFVNSRNGIDLNQTGVVGLTADLEYGGSWWVYHPFNVLGSDAADVARYQSLVNVLLPFPALSVGLGNILTAVAASQLPMNVGCTGTNLGACERIDQILSTMFDLRHIVALVSPGGYTFPQVKNPITCSADGLCDIKDPNGVTEPWSRQTQELNIFTPFENFYDSLTQTPDFSQIRFPTVTMIVNTIVNFIRGLNTAFNPFVRGTQCGLCALFVPIPADETRPGSTNPGTLIPGRPGTGMPGTEDATTEPTVARGTATDEGWSSDTDEIYTGERGDGAGVDSPWPRHAQPWRSAQGLEAVSSPEESIPGDGDVNVPAPRADDVQRGHVDGGRGLGAESGGGAEDRADTEGSADTQQDHAGTQDDAETQDHAGDDGGGDAKGGSDGKGHAGKGDSGSHRAGHRDAA